MSRRTGPDVPQASPESRLSYVLSVGKAVEVDANYVHSQNTRREEVDHRMMTNNPYTVLEVNTVLEVATVLEDNKLFTNSIVVQLNISRTLKPVYMVDTTGVDALFHSVRYRMIEETASSPQTLEFTNLKELRSLLTAKQVSWMLRKPSWKARKPFISDLERIADDKSVAIKLINDAAALSMRDHSNLDVRKMPGLLAACSGDSRVFSEPVQALRKERASILGSAIMHAIVTSIKDAHT